MVKDRLINFTSALISLAISISYGLSFGDGGSNHPVYLVEGLREVHPALLHNDWWATQTTHYHPIFAFLVASLERLGILKWGLASLNILFVSGTLYVTFLIIKRFSRSPLLSWILFLSFFVFLGKTTSIGMSYFFSHGIQPSTIATFFCVVGIYLFIEGKYGYSGAHLALAGLIHTNFTVLSFPFFFLPHILLRGNNPFRRIIKQLAFPAVALLIQLPGILYAMGMELPAEVKRQASDIFINIAVPLHYKPMIFLSDYKKLFLAVLAALPALVTYRQSPCLDRQRVVALFTTFFMIIGIATLLTTVVFIPWVSRLFFFRMAPFLFMISVILFALDLTGQVTTGKKQIISYAFAFLYLLYSLRTEMIFEKVTLIVASGLLLFLSGCTLIKTQNMEKYSVRGKQIFVALVLLAGCNHFISTMSPGRFNLVSGRDRSVSEFYQWVKTTPPESMFMVPPGMNEFRLFGERAVVADWKAIPLRPNEIQQWYERMNDLAGGTNPRSAKEAEEGYRSLEGRQLEEVIAKYNVDFIVRRKNSGPKKVIPGRIIFENTLYLVYNARPEEG